MHADVNVWQVVFNPRHDIPIQFDFPVPRVPARTLQKRRLKLTLLRQVGHLRRCRLFHKLRHLGRCLLLIIRHRRRLGHLDDRDRRKRQIIWIMGQMPHECKSLLGLCHLPSTKSRGEIEQMRSTYRDKCLLRQKKTQTLIGICRYFIPWLFVLTKLQLLSLWSINSTSHHRVPESVFKERANV